MLVKLKSFFIIKWKPVEIDFQTVFPGHTPMLVGGSLRLNLDAGPVFVALAPEAVVHHSEG